MEDARIALNRFGLGMRPGQDLPARPREWLARQLRAFDHRVPDVSGLQDSAAIVRSVARFQAEKRAARDDREKLDLLGKTQSNFARSQYLGQLRLRAELAVSSDAPFAERLTHFWANHFAVDASGPFLTPLAGRLEYEAIRPNLTGRFEDLLIAVETHPAMLFYLDQRQSIGPSSKIGQAAERRGRKSGLNENLAREILELHTLGVRSGYTQADVIAFAKALTGWTVDNPNSRRLIRLAANASGSGKAIFVDGLHEPGTRTVMGKTYNQPGENQSRAILSDLARHPATARHIARKLVIHFVADDPPPALVASLERAYLSSGGHLGAVYEALIAAPEAWQELPTKFRNPWLWGIAAMRALDLRLRAASPALRGGRMAAFFQELGQPVWRPRSPAGFGDTGGHWAAPDALYRRIELASRLSDLARSGLDPRDLAGELFGPSLSSATRGSIEAAESPGQGLALLLVSPEMLRS